MNRILLVLLVLALPGCQFIRERIGPWDPTVRVQKIQVESFSFQKIMVAVDLQVANPNFFALKLDQLTYELKINDTRVAGGSYPERLEVPSRSSATLRVPVAIAPQVALKFAKQFIAGSGTLEALWTASAKFATPLGSVDLDVREIKPLLTKG